MSDLHRPQWSLPKKYSTTTRAVILLAVCALSTGAFLLSSDSFLKIGFPLDDAWIHQTYARNLVEHGQWVYIPGQVSAGSTSPAWTLLLAAGYLLGSSPPYVWTFLLGILALFGVALTGERLFNQLRGAGGKGFPWAGVFLALEWHLVWGAVSGMETVLFALLILAVFTCLTAAKPRFLIAGMLVGLSCWVRPDGLTLLGPALFFVVLGAGGWRDKIRSGLITMAGFALIFGGYLAFNYSLARTLLPNTFYAKQAEYAALLAHSLWKRLVSLAFLPAIGAGSLLIPGLVGALWRMVAQRTWSLIAMLLWWLGYTAVYALRLPVTYQHGRYLIPAMPVIFILGLVGTERLLRIEYKASRIGWALARLILVSLVALQLMFTYLGAKAYGEDVAIIESEMVATAHWLNQHTEPDAVIAVHDIGAIGYFSQRRLLDLAGLVSPEVIPFIRDEARLAEYLDQNQADYLVTFPGWYPNLVSLGSEIFTTGSRVTLDAGGENMAVYAWRE